MNNTERFEKQVILDYIIDQVKYQKKETNETGRFYFMEGIKFLNDIRKGLESIANGKIPKQRNLKKIFKAIAGEKNTSRESVLKVAGRLEDVQGQLEQIAEDPEEFYKKENTEKLLDICMKIKEVYSI